jgi:two-component system sensor histidine kinase AgrC
MTFLIYSFFSVYCDIILGLFLFKNFSEQSITRKQFSVIVFLGIGNIIIQYIFRNYRAESIVNLLMFIIINWYIATFFKIKLKNRLLYLIFFFLISMISEGVAFYLLNGLFFVDNSKDIFLLVGMFITNIFKTIFILLTVRKAEKNGSDDVELPNAIFHSLLIIPFLSAFILISILYLDYYYIDFSEKIVFAVLVAMFLINISVFVIFNGIRTYYREYVNTLKILNNIEKKVDHYQNLEKSIENIRLIKHDLKNSMITTLGFLISGNKDRAISYLNELVEATDDNQLVFFTKNEIINFLLNNKISIAEKNQITVSTNILIPERISLENDIISVILGNILDNAINACIEMDSDDKYIDIKIKVYQKNLIIRVENTYEPENRYYHKNKSSGLGLISVRKLVEQKNGIYKVDLNEKKYIVTILIFNIM